MTTDSAAGPPPALPVSHPLTVARLSRNAPTRFDIRPEAPALLALAGLLGISHLRKLRFCGQLQPCDGGDWVLTGDLGATVVQPCGVTLVPVTTRLEEPVTRRYLADAAAHWPTSEGGERELPEDVDAEPLGATIDPAAVMVEALALAVPAFPRAPGAELGEAVFTRPGAAPLRDADLHPMAGLAALRDKLARE